MYTLELFSSSRTTCTTHSHPLLRTLPASSGPDSAGLWRRQRLRPWPQVGSLWVRGNHFSMTWTDSANLTPAFDPAYPWHRARTRKWLRVRRISYKTSIKSVWCSCHALFPYFVFSRTYWPRACSSIPTCTSKLKTWTLYTTLPPCVCEGVGVRGWFFCRRPPTTPNLCFYLREAICIAFLTSAMCYINPIGFEQSHGPLGLVAHCRQ